MKLLLIIFSLFSSMVLAQDHKLISIDIDYLNEKSITRLRKSELEEYRLKINKRGQLTNTYNQLLNSTNLPSGAGIFILTKDMKFYVATRRNYLKFTHATLASKQPVICAGDISTDNRGKIKWISDLSVTYVTKKGNEKPLRAVIKKLRLMGADLSKMRVFFYWNL